jgi:hypothetical protein
MPVPNKNKKHHRTSKKSRAIERQGHENTPVRPNIASAQPSIDTRVTANVPVSQKASAKSLVLPEYPYIAAELKRIGILAAAVIIILVILAIIL